MWTAQLMNLHSCWCNSGTWWCSSHCWTYRCERVWSVLHRKGFTRDQNFNTNRYVKIPLSVAVYVIQGGLRSTFVADYIHTVILFVAIFIFAFTLYTTDSFVGSPGKFYDLLTQAAEASPLAGNAHGSWLTFRSHDGLVFAALIFLGSFSTVWLDQAYWQRAIASRPETSVKAYLLGGVSPDLQYELLKSIWLTCTILVGVVWDPVWLCDSNGSGVRSHDQFPNFSYIPKPSQCDPSRRWLFSSSHGHCPPWQERRRADVAVALHGHHVRDLRRADRRILLMDI
jgi:hypothetical protein